MTIQTQFDCCEENAVASVEQHMHPKDGKQGTYTEHLIFPLNRIKDIDRLHYVWASSLNSVQSLN